MFTVLLRPRNLNSSLPCCLTPKHTAQGTFEVRRTLQCPATRKPVDETQSFSVDSLTTESPADLYRNSVRGNVHNVTRGTNAAITFLGSQSEFSSLSDYFENMVVLALLDLMKMLPGEKNDILVTIAALSCRDGTVSDVIKTVSETGVPQSVGVSGIPITTDDDIRRITRILSIHVRSYELLTKSHVIVTLRTSFGKLAFVRTAPIDSPPPYTRCGRDLSSLLAAASCFSDPHTTESVAMRQSKLLVLLRDVLNSDSCGTFLVFVDAAAASYTRTVSTCKYASQLYQNLHTKLTTSSNSATEPVGAKRTPQQPPPRPHDEIPIPIMQSQRVLSEEVIHNNKRDHRDDIDTMEEDEEDEEVDVEVSNCTTQYIDPVTLFSERERARVDALEMKLAHALGEARTTSSSMATNSLLPGGYDSMTALRRQIESLQTALRSQSIQTATLQSEKEVLLQATRRMEETFEMERKNSQHNIEFARQQHLAELAILREELFQEKRRRRESEDMVGRLQKEVQELKEEIQQQKSDEVQEEVANKSPCPIEKLHIASNMSISYPEKFPVFLKHLQAIVDEIERI
eukprot:PhF_6_TR14238/c0_g1_i3/m.22838